MKPPAFVCDLDGTTCNLAHRLHLLQVKCEACDGTGHLATYNGKHHPIRLCKACGGKGHRRDMDAFHAAQGRDKPHAETLAVVQALAGAGYTPVFLTCRPIRYRAETLAWLKRHGFLDHCQNPWPAKEPELLMRKGRDKRADPAIKAEFYRRYIQPRFQVILWLEDRTSVVRMVRDELGLPCWQVRPGDF